MTMHLTRPIVFWIELCTLETEQTFRERTGRMVKSFVDEAQVAYIEAARMHSIMQKKIAANLVFSFPSACGNWMRKHLPNLRLGKFTE